MFKRLMLAIGIATLAIFCIGCFGFIEFAVMNLSKKFLGNEIYGLSVFTLLIFTTVIYWILLPDNNTKD